MRSYSSSLAMRETGSDDTTTNDNGLIFPCHRVLGGNDIQQDTRITDDSRRNGMALAFLGGS